MQPGAAMKAVRIFRPSSVRTGMFCRFGSDEESRPVVVAASENEVCTRRVPSTAAATRLSV